MVENKKVLIVGCGSIGKRHARILKELGVKQIGLADQSASQLALALREIQGAQGYASYEEALKDQFDAVILCTPPHLHIAQARLAIEANCDVMTEKPLTVHLDGVQELQSLLRVKSRFVMVAMCFRYHAGLRRIKQLVREGEIGRLIHIRASMGENLAEARPNIDYRQLFVVSEDVGVTLDMCHEPDYVQWIADQPVTSVTAITGKLSNLEMAGDDIADLLIKFKGSLTSSIHLDFFQQRRRRYSEYIGTEGTLLLEMADWNTCCIHIYHKDDEACRVETLTMERDDMFREMDRDFLELLDTRQKPELDIQEGLKCLQIVWAAKESSKTGKTVVLKPAIE